MPLDGVEFVDASRSTFNDVGGDQTINYFTYFMNFTVRHPCDSRRTLHPYNMTDNDSDIRWPAAGTATSSRGGDIISMSRSSVSIVDIAADLVDKLVQLLIYDGETLDKFGGLMESLHLRLMVTQSALLAFKHTPVGRCLSHTINTEVVVVLQEVFDNISCYQQALQSTSIHSLWRQVFSSGGELVLLILKISACKRALDSFLMALNSVEWTKFGNQLNTGHPCFETFLVCLRHRRPFLNHIPLHKVHVVDHLGQNISVPLQFCTTWEAFDYIITGYCENRIGNHFVKRGDYGLIRAEDSQWISPSEFPCIAEPGVVLEMSIIMRQKTSYQENKKKCPRCRFVDSNVASPDGWIECHRCSGRFQVTNADKNNDENDENDGEIGSSASRTEESNITQRAVNEDPPPPQDGDGTQFFRRIQIICMDGIDRPPLWENITSAEKRKGVVDLPALSPTASYPSFAYRQKEDSYFQVYDGVQRRRDSNYQLTWNSVAGSGNALFRRMADPTDDDNGLTSNSWRGKHKGTALTVPNTDRVSYSGLGVHCVKLSYFS